MEIFKPQVTGTAAQFENVALWGKIELVKNPLVKTILVSTETGVKLESCVQVRGVLVLLG
jgi:hypothetical protein